MNANHQTTENTSQILFEPNLDGSKAYRIPSLITTLDGTVIAGSDARIESPRDNPNKINTTIRRSVDDGETWGDVQTIVEYAGEGLDGAAAIDTAILQDQETKTIWMLFLHTPGGIGLASSEQGMGFVENGNRSLFDTEGKFYSLASDGTVYTSEGDKTDFRVDEAGDVFQNGVQKGNIYLKQGVDPEETLLEERTSFLQVIKSDDDGVTWSKPIDLNAQVKEPWMRFIGACPGRGLQIEKGQYKGRLVFPIYFSNEHKKMSCAVIYSDDHGETWHRGASPNDNRVFNGVQLHSKTVNMDHADLTESQVIEMENGDLRIYMRNHSKQQRTAVATSTDGGQTWQGIDFDHTLLDPICQSTVITLPQQQQGKTTILFANPASEENRENGTVRLSEDGGQTWPYSKTIEKGIYSYSCLTQLSSGEIGVLYEHIPEGLDPYHMEIRFMKFSVEWLKDS